MIKKNWFLLIFALVLAIGFVFAGSGGGDMHVMGILPSLNFPSAGIYDYYVAYFSLSLINTTPLTYCNYTLNDMSKAFNCSAWAYININSAEGDNALTIYLESKVGSENSTWNYGVNFFMDSLIPQIDITSPTNGTQYGSLITQLDYDINEANLDSCWYSVDGGSAQSTTCINGANSISLTSHEDWNTWTICANDTVGHKTCSNVTFFVDSIHPTIEFSADTTPSGILPQNSITIDVICSDTNKQAVVLNWNGTDELFVTKETKILGDGTYNFFAYCNDTVGHIVTTETRTIMLDTTAPVVTLISPYNNQPFAFDQNVTFNFNVSEANPYACDLILNGNIYQTNFSNGNTLSLPSGNQYTWNIQCTDLVGNSNTAPESNTFTVLSNLTFPPGTNFPDLTLEPNISSVWFWVRNQYGMINWTQPLDLSRGLDWANYIGLTFNNANVNSILAPELNKQAGITLYNISWNSPQILRDGEICSSDICTELLGSYVANVSYMFNVSGFSTYETRETPVITYGTSGGSTCKTNWTCTAWSTCFENIQTRTCTKVKLFCNTYTDKPAEKQSCIEQKSANTTQVEEQAPEQQAIINNQPQKGTGITGFVAAHPASTAATLIAILGVASYFVVSRIRAKSLNPEPAKTGGKEGVTWITSKSTEKVDSI